MFRVFLGVFLVFLRVSRAFGGVPGFLGVFRVFLGMFLVFLRVFRVLGGCSRFLGVPECSVMFRCSWKYYMPGSAPIWGGKKGEFRDWTRITPP